jgi:type IV secretory pathway VirB10-like protein
MAAPANGETGEATPERAAAPPPPQQQQQEEQQQQESVEQQQQEEGKVPPADDYQVFIGGGAPSQGFSNPFTPYIEPSVKFVETNGWFMLFGFIILWFFKSRLETWQNSPARLKESTKEDLEKKMREKREEQTKKWREDAVRAKKEEERRKLQRKHDEAKKQKDKYDPDRYFKPDRVRRAPPSSGGGGSGPSLRNEFRAARKPRGG